jgi:hypothetical protein
MRWLSKLGLAALVVTGSCSFDGGVFSDLNGATNLCEDWNPQHFDPCALPPPVDQLDLNMDGSPWAYDTDTGILTDASGTPSTPPSFVSDQVSGGMLRVISANHFGLESAARLRVTGSIPLLIAAFADITIAGTLDASSHGRGEDGPGANPALCSANAAMAGVPGESGSGGGGGGGYQGQGSAGGEADENTTDGFTKAGGPGGAAVGSVPLVVVGGCSGADSGLGGGVVGAGGSGGGAIQLSAFESIQVSGVIQTGGAGGGGGPDSSACGGGGGGAGGYIGLEAPQVDSSQSTLAANGGAGGEGTNRSLEGEDGEDGKPSAEAAQGGEAGSNCGTSGGQGSADIELNGGPVDPLDSCGGGGGGGGAGYILIRSAVHTTQSPVISPPAIVTTPTE